jgi:capsular exopolysaccharide synthesis family protein
MEPLSSPDEGARLRQYLGILRRRKWAIILVSLFSVVGAFLYAERSTPIYRSTASVQATTTVLLAATSTGANLSMQTEQQAVTSDPVTKCAALLIVDQTFRADPTGAPVDTSEICTPEALAAAEVPEGLASDVLVSVPPQTNVLDIEFDDPSPKVAQLGAQAFALGYIHFKVDRAEQLLDQLRAPLLKAQEGLNKEVTKLNDDLDKAIQDNTDNPSPGGNAEVQNLTSQRNAAQQKLDNITLQILNLDPSHINPPQLLLPAKLPRAPVSPNKVLAGLVGLFVGLALGVAVGLVRERLDDRLQGRSDLEEQARAPVLAVVPRLKGRRRPEAVLVTRADPKGVSAEAYRKLRTSVLFAGAQRRLKVVMIGSALAGDGKTTTAANLAVLLAEADKRVILVSADLRRPRLHRYFDIDASRGLSDVLAGRVDLLDVLVNPGIPNLRVVPSGALPDRPAELLESHRMAEVIEELRGVADYVIADTAPLLLVSEALGIALLSDGVIIVADAGKTSRWAVRHARDQLDEVAATVVGSVLNRFDPSSARGYPQYGYYYESRYGYAYGGENGPDAENGEAKRGAVGAGSRRRRFKS